jgi:hypothetical protein
MDKNSSPERLVLKPGIASSLSTVPPVCPSPRPLILATGNPNAARIGTTTRVVLSPTPPVECLSTVIPLIADKSTVSPEATIARVKAVVSSALMPLKYIAISNADIW